MRYQGEYSVRESLDLLHLFESMNHTICNNYKSHLSRGINRWSNFLYDPHDFPKVVGTNDKTRNFTSFVSFVDMIKIGLKYAK